MNPHLWLADFIADMVKLHQMMIGIGVLIAAVCFKAFVPTIAKDTDLAVRGWVRVAVAAGLVCCFGFVSETSGGAFNDLAAYIYPKWNSADGEFERTVEKVLTARLQTAPSSASHNKSWNVVGNMARDLSDNVYAAIIGACMTLLAYLAQSVIFFMEIAHTVLLNVEYALIPAFLGFIAHPRTAFLAYGLLTSFFGIQLWIPALSIVMRINDSLMRNAFTSATNSGGGVLSVGNLGGVGSPAVTMLVLLGAFALWTVFTILAVPGLVKKMMAGAGFAGGFVSAGGSPMVQMGMMGAKMAAGAAMGPGGAVAVGALGSGAPSGGSTGGSGSEGGTPSAGAAAPLMAGGTMSGGDSSLSAPPPEINRATGKSEAAGARPSKSQAPQAQVGPQSAEQNNPYSPENLETLKAGIYKDIRKGS